MIDTHCHLNFEAFDDDRDAVVARAAAAGVTRIVIPSIDRETNAQVVALTRQYEGVYGAVGVHPNSSDSFDPAWLDAFAAQAADAKIVAIGEIGLDYYWDKVEKAAQQRVFEAQLALAAQLALPVIIHNRDAHADVMDTLERWAATLPPELRTRAGVLHSFSAPAEIGERALAAGFYLGFTGPITYKNADVTRRVAGFAPLDRILVETDAPYLTPTPHRGKRNEPAYIPLMVERLASLKQVSVETMAAATTANAERLFALPRG